MLFLLQGVATRLSHTLPRSAGSQLDSGNRPEDYTGLYVLLGLCTDVCFSHVLNPKHLCRLKVICLIQVLAASMSQRTIYSHISGVQVLRIGSSCFPSVGFSDLAALDLPQGSAEVPEASCRNPRAGHSVCIGLQLHFVYVITATYLQFCV